MDWFHQQFTWYMTTMWLYYMKWLQPPMVVAAVYKSKASMNCPQIFVIRLQCYLRALKKLHRGAKYIHVLLHSEARLPLSYSCNTATTTKQDRTREQPRQHTPSNVTNPLILIERSVTKLGTLLLTLAWSCLCCGHCSKRRRRAWPLLVVQERITSASRLINDGD